MDLVCADPQRGGLPAFLAHGLARSPVSGVRAGGPGPASCLPGGWSCVEGPVAHRPVKTRFDQWRGSLPLTKFVPDVL